VAAGMAQVELVGLVAEAEEMLLGLVLVDLL
jgi:hypothetical protein